MSYLGRKKIIKTNWPIRASSVVTWSRSRHEHVLRCDHAAGSCRENWMKERTNGNESFPTHFVYSVWTHHVSALLSTLACVVFLYTFVYLLYTVLLREWWETRRSNYKNDPVNYDLVFCQFRSRICRPVTGRKRGIFQLQMKWWNDELKCRLTWNTMKIE